MCNSDCASTHDGKEDGGQNGRERKGWEAGWSLIDPGDHTHIYTQHISYAYTHAYTHTHLCYL